jgi:3-deoxy-D-manno-octulosonic-acid transferase
MNWLYNFSILLLGFFIRIYSVFSPKAKKWVDGRRNWDTLLDSIPKNEKICWFHCASLGEFDQGLELMFLLKKRSPSSLIVVTFFSPSGMEHYQKRKNCVDYALYLPLDTPRNANLFMDKLAPDYAIFIKYEFWANFIFAAKKKGVVLLSVSTLLRRNQVYFKFYGGFFRKVLRSFDYFFVQNKETADLLHSIQITNVEITGDTRFDRVIANKQFSLTSMEIESQNDRLFNVFLNGEKAIIFGSSWQSEEELLHALLASGSRRKIIIAPHDIQEVHVQEIVSRLGKKAIRYTKFNDYKEQQVLVLDTIGQLSMAYYYGDIAVVGGGFSGKLHNILEPLAFGLPVIFGPKHSKFPEADQAITNQFAFSVSSKEAFLEAIQLISNDIEKMQALSMHFILDNSGASKKISENKLFTF